MNQKRLKKIIGVVLSLLVVAVNYSTPVQQLTSLPDALVLREGQEVRLAWGLPLKVRMNQQDAAVISSGDETLSDVARTDVELAAVNAGQAQVQLSLFGSWP